MSEPNAPRVVIAAGLDDGSPPAPGEVRVWVIPLGEPAAGVGDFPGDLTPDEVTRADRYKVAKARQQFVVGRGSLRRLLGRHLGVAPRDVPITYTGAGKPALAGGTGPEFNVTHTDGLALIALAAVPVGIDVERVRPLADPGGLVARFFSEAERAAFFALPAELRPAGFWRGWTSKEAVIKAGGLSVTILGEFDVELHPGRAAALLGSRHPALAGGGYALAAWEPAAGFAAAVALAAGPRG